MCGSLMLALRRHRARMGPLQHEVAAITTTRPTKRRTAARIRKALQEVRKTPPAAYHAVKYWIDIYPESRKLTLEGEQIIREQVSCADSANYTSP